MMSHDTVEPVSTRTNGHERRLPISTSAAAAPAPPTFFAVAWRHRLALVVGLVVGLLLGLLVSLAQPTSYTSESRIFFSSQMAFDPLGDDSFTSDPSRYLEQQAALLTSESVLQQAVRADATIGDVEEVRRSLTVTASREADIVTVRSAAETATRAAARVVAVVSAYREYQRAAVTEQTNAVTALSSDAERRQIEQRAALYGDGVEMVEPPASREAAVLVRNLTVGGLVGLLLALAWALTRRRPADRAAAGSQPSPRRHGRSRQGAAVDDDWQWDRDQRG